MQNYRIYNTNAHIKVERFPRLKCKDDLTATYRALNYLEQGDVEVWREGQLVVRLNRNDWRTLEVMTASVQLNLGGLFERLKSRAR